LTEPIEYCKKTKINYEEWVDPLK